ncbi:pyocin knob domain-containing protein [uncultured Limosilactobacillus sp.]|uniref:pyocin knob domain-containing protein n=1 Tax=uncultured Limosilactobacillus sp. TaxID=2837629 RepID=UPI00258AA655|nr:pyocin knob domain-containing protein [uncultured Limosilactobacillus sp.]
MNDLLTLIMTIVRKMTGTTDKLSTSDALNLLNSLPIFHYQNKYHIYNSDLNDLDQPGAFLFSGGKSNNLPAENLWWLVINLPFSKSNGFQIAIGDNYGYPTYIRARGAGTWRPWNKLGGQ